MPEEWKVSIPYDSSECPHKVAPTTQGGFRCGEKLYTDHKKRTKNAQCNIHNCPHKVVLHE